MAKKSKKARGAPARKKKGSKKAMPAKDKTGTTAAPAPVVPSAPP